MGTNQFLPDLINYGLKSFMSAMQPSASSLTLELRLVATTKDDVTNHVGNNNVIVQEALRMNLPLHLVQNNIQRRIQTHNQPYTNLGELVTDLLNPTEKDKEVPMETDQLEEALQLQHRRPAAQ